MLLHVRGKDCPHMDLLVTVEETAVCCMSDALALNVNTYCTLYVLALNVHTCCMFYGLALNARIKCQALMSWHLKTVLSMV